ncbi:MAG: hypothetical protein GY793_09535 [Proteobacteria bacterium]|nr:hypothetical protein [Pseudomonadota bacterium]
MVEFKDNLKVEFKNVVPEIKKGGGPTFDKFGPTAPKSSHWSTTKPEKKKKKKAEVPKVDITMAEVRKVVMFTILGVIIFASTILLSARIFPEGGIPSSTNSPESVIKELTAFGKAHDRYVKDTKSLLPSEKKKSLRRKTFNLIQNITDVKNWKGPYLEGYTSDKDGAIKGESALKSRNNLSNIAIGYYALDMTRCKKGNCYIWISMNVPHSYDKTLKALDQKFDGQLSRLSGRFIYKKRKSSYFVAFAHAKK